MQLTYEISKSKHGFQYTVLYEHENDATIIFSGEARTLEDVFENLLSFTKRTLN